MRIHIFTGTGKSKTERIVVISMIPLLISGVIFGVVCTIFKMGFDDGKESITK